MNPYFLASILALTGAAATVALSAVLFFRLHQTDLAFVVLFPGAFLGGVTWAMLTRGLQ